MKRLSWLTLLLVLTTIPTIVFAQFTPKDDPQLREFLQKVQPNFGGVWKPAPAAKAVSVTANTNTPPQPVPLPPPLVSIGASVWSNGETYLVPVHRPADISIKIYVDGVLTAEQTGAVTRGSYDGEEKSLDGTFPVTGAGAIHNVLILATDADGNVFEIPGTYELPLHPVPQVIPVTTEGQNYRDITPHAIFIGGSAEHIDLKGSFVVMGEYTSAVEEWNPNDPDYKAPRLANGRAMAVREGVHLRNGELVANYRYGLNYFNGIVVYKFFLKNLNGTFTTHEAVKARMKEYQAPEKPGPSPIEFHVRNPWWSTITSKIVTEKAVNGYYYIQLYGYRTDGLCADEWQNYMSASAWGVIPPGQDSYTVALNMNLPSNFEFSVVIYADLEMSQYNWQYYRFGTRFRGVNNPQPCYTDGGKG